MVGQKQLIEMADQSSVPQTASQDMKCETMAAAFSNVKVVYLLIFRMRLTTPSWVTDERSMERFENLFCHSFGFNVDLEHFRWGLLGSVDVAMFSFRLIRVV